MGKQNPENKSQQPSSQTGSNKTTESGGEGSDAGGAAGTSDTGGEGSDAGDAADICQLPQDPGPCRAAFTSYWYNALTNVCEEFFYGGCAGNENRFAAQADCENQCKNG